MDQGCSKKKKGEKPFLYAKWEVIIFVPFDSSFFRFPIPEDKAQ